MRETKSIAVVDNAPIFIVERCMAVILVFVNDALSSDSTQLITVLDFGQRESLQILWPVISFEDAARGQQ